MKLQLKTIATLAILSNSLIVIASENKSSFNSLVVGNIYNINGVPIKNVEVSYLNKKDFSHTFTDTTGYFKLKLTLDGIPPSDRPYLDQPFIPKQPAPGAPPIFSPINRPWRPLLRQGRPLRRSKSPSARRTYSASSAWWP